MKKRCLAFSIAFLILMSGMAVLADGIDFPDLPSDHWAYDAVQQLVSEGTVSGTDQGLFEPDKLVTRAEFVRMIGKDTAKRDKDFGDVPQSHWGYEYIMYSGVDGDADNKFYPDEPMTRGDVVSLLWKRAGSPGGVAAPSIITGQSQNKEAVSWIYMYGVMIGNDGVNLRLDEGISRAEVSSLIIRSRQISENSNQINFVDVVSDQLLERIFNGVGIFDKPYSADGTLTNGELARAAIRQASEEYDLTYRDFSAEAPFEHPYAKDLYVLGNNCIGAEKVTQEFIDQPANNLDMVASLTYGMMRKSHKTIGYDTASVCYSDVTGIDKNIQHTCLTFANHNGVQLYANAAIRPDKTATMCEMAAVMLQLDSFIGTQSAITTDLDARDQNVAVDVSLEHNLDRYPWNADFYQHILSGLPAEVYTTDFELMETMDGSFGKNPKANYSFAKDFGSLFVAQLNKEKDKIKQNSGVTVRFTYYPSLVSDNKRGFTCRIKTEILDMGGQSLAYNQVFSGSLGESIDTRLYDGMVFYHDIVMEYILASDPNSQVNFGRIAAIEK